MNTGALQFFANYRTSNLNNKLSCFFNFENQEPNNFIKSKLGKDSDIITGYIYPETGEFWNKKNNAGFISGNYIVFENIGDSSFNFNNFSYIVSIEKLNSNGGVLLSSINKNTKPFINLNGETIDQEYYKGFEFGVTANNYLYFEYFKNTGPEVLISDNKINDKSVVYLLINNNNINYGSIDFNNNKMINTNFNVLSNYFFNPNSLFIGYNPLAVSLYNNNESFVGYIEDIIFASPSLFNYEVLNISSGFIYDFTSALSYPITTITTGITGSYRAVTGYRSRITGYEKVPTGIFTNPWGVSIMGYTNQPLIEQIPLSGTFYLSGEIINTSTGFSGVFYTKNFSKLLSYQNNVINFLNKIDDQDLIDYRFMTGYDVKIFNKKNVFITYDRFSDSYLNPFINENYYNIFVNGQLQKSGNVFFSNLPYQNNQLIIADDYGIDPRNRGRFIFNNFYGLKGESSVFIDVNSGENIYFNEIVPRVNINVPHNFNNYDLFLNGQKLIENIDYTINKYRLWQNLSGNNIGDLFGLSIAYAKENHLLTIGVPSYDEGNTNAGGIFIYTGNPENGWAYNNKILSSGIIDYMGSKVSTNKDGSVIVTNCQAGLGLNQQNDVHIYTGNINNGWNLHQILTGVVDYNAGDWLKISYDGEVILIGDISYDNYKGAVSVYTKRQNGNWEFIQQIVGSNNSDFFGYSVDISDVFSSVIVIGAIGDDAGGSNAGAGFIYSRIPGINSNWIFRQKITGLASLDRFGESVAINTNGTVVAVGGNLHDPAGLTNAGGAIIFTGLAPFGDSLPNSWKYKETLPGTIENGNFGKNVRINSNGNIIALGGTNNFILYSGDKSNFPYAFPNGWKLIQTITGINNDLELNSDGNILISTELSHPNSIDNVYIYKNDLNYNFYSDYSGILIGIPKNYDLSQITSGTPIINLNDNFYYNNTEIYVNGVRQTLNYDYLELSKNDVSTGIKILLENNKDYIYNNEGFIK